MVEISHETPIQTENRLLKVIAQSENLNFLQKAILLKNFS